MTVTPNEYPSEFIGLFRDRTHGAQWLVERFLKLALISVDQKCELRLLVDASRAFRDAFPAMAPVHTISGRVEKLLRVCNTNERALISLRNLVNEFKYQQAKFTEYLLQSPPSAESLALFSNSSTVVNGLLALSSNAYTCDLYVAESLPGGEGADAAKNLAMAGYHTTLVKDEVFQRMLLSNTFDRVILGADALDGFSFINKIGSAKIMDLASEAKIAVEIWTYSSKIVRRDTFQRLSAQLEIEAESQSGSLFECCSLELISLVRTDRGSYSPDRFHLLGNIQD